MVAKKSKTLAQMTAEIRAVNIEKGWRSAGGGPAGNTWGDYVALLHSELGEATDAYRDHRTADATTTTVHATPPHGRPKPQGIGSEFADVLIRLLDMGDVFGFQVFDMDMELADVDPTHAGIIDRARLISFGDWITWMHKRVTVFGDDRPDCRGHSAAGVLRGLVAISERFFVDLGFEYERKIAFNRTRPYQHGGRTLAGDK